MKSNEVLDSAAEVESLFSRDLNRLFDLRIFAEENSPVSAERLVTKSQAIEEGSQFLSSMTSKHKGDDDAAFRAVIEKFVPLLDAVSPADTDDAMQNARNAGRKEGLEHVLYRVRNARG
jgi:hypothetical protein